MRTLLSLSLVFALSVLSGCGGSEDGTDLTFEDITPGTSQQDVTKILGPPIDYTTENGIVIEYYPNANGETYVVRYDKKGNVESTEVLPAQ